MKTLYPLTLKRHFDSRVWGGSRLAAWMNESSVPAPLAEVWLVYEENEIATGPFAGQALGDVVKQLGADLVGTRSWNRWGGQFPLLAKFLDAEAYLSLQVHPDDAYAQRVEADSGFHGKTEAWYILDTQPGAHILYGWNSPTSRETCIQALEDESILDLVRHVAVQPHDVIYVPAGTIHAIAPGVMLFEIQQKSDLTYRLYDYGRPRELQIEQALDVLSYAESAPPTFSPIALDSIRTRVLESAFFVMDRWQLHQPAAFTTALETFDILTIVDGTVTLEKDDYTHVFQRGEAVVLPAAMGKYTLIPDPTALILRCGIE